MGILEERLQMMNWLEAGNKRKSFDEEFNEYINGFYDDYSYLDEYSIGSHSDLTTEAWLVGCEVTGNRLKQSDIHKVKRYNKDK